MILRKTVKTERPSINFYYEDIITYINKTQYSLDLQSNSKTIYKQLFKTNMTNALLKDNLFGINAYLKTHGTNYRISCNRQQALNKHWPLISAAPSGIHIEISTFL